MQFFEHFSQPSGHRPDKSPVSHSKPHRLYSYLDYREFLRDEIAHQKATNPKFSYRYFNLKAGLKSAGHLKMITQGKANAGPRTVYKICKGLGLPVMASRFFTALVNFNQAETHSEKDRHYNDLIKQYPPKQARLFGEAHYTIFNHWYYVVILELVRLPTFREDPPWIAQQLKPTITTQKAKKALQDLESLGLLVRDEADQLVRAERALTTPDAVASLAVVNYNAQLIAHASNAIRRDALDKKEFSTITAAMSDATFGQVKQKIQEFSDALHDFIENAESQDSNTQVAHINLQLFQMTKDSNS